VDKDPGVKISSDTVDRNECRQVLQVQVVLAASDRRNTLMECLVNMTILLEAPNYSHDHDVIFNYKEVFNMVQGENDDHTVRIMNHYHGESLDQVIYAQHMIIGIRITLIDSKCYHNLFTFLFPQVFTTADLL
jgi:hypothetical protein